MNYEYELSRVFFTSFKALFMLTMRQPLPAPVGEGWP